VGFSLDGLERTHDCVRKARQSYRKVLEAVDATVRVGLPVVAVTHITHRNLDEIEELHGRLHRHGVFIWQVQLGVPMGNMAGEREALLDHADVVQLIPRLAALNRAGRAPRVVSADNVGYFSDFEAELRRPGSEIDFWLGCRAGIDVVGIESHGDVKGCLSLPSELNGRRDFIEGNLRQRSLAAMWNDPDGFAYNRKFHPDQLQGSCRGCEYGEICRGGCTWTAVCNTGRPHDFPACYHRGLELAGAGEAAAAP
jgi:radical SAM protein with 4Fe4S-binding SPASM domain